MKEREPSRWNGPSAPCSGESSYRRSQQLVSKGTAWRMFGAGIALGGVIVLINTLHQATASMMYFTAGFLLVVGIFFAIFGKKLA